MLKWSKCVKWVGYVINTEAEPRLFVPGEYVEQLEENQGHQCDDNVPKVQNHRLHRNSQEHLKEKKRSNYPKDSSNSQTYSPSSGRGKVLFK